MEPQDCYVFTPKGDGTERAQKRRKKNQPTTSIAQNIPFSGLLRGNESDRSVEYRFDLFQNLWLSQEEALQGIIDGANLKTIEAVTSFVNSALEPGRGSNLPAGLIVQGPENSTFSSFYDILYKELARSEHTTCIKLTSGQCPNLKTILRYVNQTTTLPADELDSADRRVGSKLNYDLQMLHNHMERKSLRQIVLLFEDSEGLEGALLSDLIEYLKFWNDRISFVLLFGIATSTEIFQKKLSQNAILHLDGNKFEIQPVDVERMFKIVHSGSSKLFLGAGLSKFIFEGQRKLISNAQSFVQTVKYAYMSHIFSNPLSIWLDSLAASHQSDQKDIDIIRYLPSFRSVILQYIEEHEYGFARKLLVNDVELRHFILKGADSGLKALHGLKSAVDALHIISEVLHSHGCLAKASWSELYILAISDQISGSDFLKDILAALKRLKSNVLQECLDFMQQKELAHEDADLLAADSASDLRRLMEDVSQHTILRSAHDIELSNLRATIVAHKVELGRHCAKITENETLYTKILERFVSKVEHFLQTHFFNPQNLFLNEIFLYDTKKLHREVFMPRPRFAIERALNFPHDYLSCSCCTNALGSLSASQPATAIMYQLYLESGGLINVADLCTAYLTILGPEDGKDDDIGHERALALLPKALAELKYLGLIQSNRKKVDHVAKLTWPGL